jgi:hypothetical protein
VTGRPREGPAFMVVGSPRSGTTLVQRLACELPGVAMPPETHFFDLFVRGLLQRGKPPFDAARIADEVARWAALPELRGVSVDPASVVSLLDSRCTRVTDLFDAILGAMVGDAPRYGEKTPNHLYWWRPLARAFPHLRFIAVVRDPRAVVASNLAAPWAAAMFHPRWGDSAYVAMAERCRFELETVLQLTTGLPDRSLVLRYEDVISDPAAARDAIAALIKPAVDSAVAATRDYVLPWESWKAGALAPVDTSRLTAWRKDLDARRAATVAGVCRGVMSRFGYPTTAGERLDALGARLRLSPSTQYRRATYRRHLAEDARWIASGAL